MGIGLLEWLAKLKAEEAFACAELARRCVHKIPGLSHSFSWFGFLVAFFFSSCMEIPLVIGFGIILLCIIDLLLELERLQLYECVVNFHVPAKCLTECLRDVSAQFIF